MQRRTLRALLDFFFALLLAIPMAIKRGLRGEREERRRAESARIVTGFTGGSASRCGSTFNHIAPKLIQSRTKCANRVDG